MPALVKLTHQFKGPIAELCLRRIAQEYSTKKLVNGRLLLLAQKTYATAALTAAADNLEAIATLTFLKNTTVAKIIHKLKLVTGVGAMTNLAVSYIQIVHTSGGKTVVHQIGINPSVQGQNATAAYEIEIDLAVPIYVEDTDTLAISLMIVVQGEAAADTSLTVYSLGDVNAVTQS